MFKNIIFTFYIILFLCLSGCYKNPPVHKTKIIPTKTASLTSTRTNTPTLEPSATSTPTITNAPTEIPTLEIKSKGIKLPPLLVSISSSKDSDGDCRESLTTQIHYISDNQAELLLADPQKNYKFPSFSPDGKSIAYVESTLNISEVNYDEFSPSEYKEVEVHGYDSVWLMDVESRTRKRISQYLPNSYSVHYYGCRSGSRIMGSPIWSPRGDYLLFEYYENQTKYFLIDMSTMGISELPIYEPSIYPTWIPNTNSFITVESRSLNIFTVNSPSDITHKIIDFPLEARWHQSASWMTDGDDNLIQFLNDKTIIVTFHLQGTQRFDISYVTWTLNLETKEWEKFVTEDQWKNLIIGNEYSVSCYGRVYLIRNENWGHIKTFGDVGHFNLCSGLILFQLPNGEELASYINANQDKVVVRNFTDHEVIVPFDISTISYPSEYKYIVDHEWLK